MLILRLHLEAIFLLATIFQSPDSILVDNQTGRSLPLDSLASDFVNCLVSLYHDRSLSSQFIQNAWVKSFI